MRRHSRNVHIDRVCRRLFRRHARRFVREQDGAAAIEFGLVALPFLALLFAILETALVFFANQTLEVAATDSARLILTGQAQSAGYNQASFKTQVVCNLLKTGVSLFDCENGVQVDVQTYTSFSAVNSTPPVTNGQLDTSKLAYSPGKAGDIVVVRLYYQWPIYVTLLGNKLDNLNGGKRLLVATSVFRNEPF
jgi:Flp pilus assembly protein TadG